MLRGERKMHLIDQDFSYWQTLPDAEKLLRMLLFSQHSHNGSSACLYGDDGERVCNACLCDFKRDTVQELQNKMSEWNMREYMKNKERYENYQTKSKI